MARPTNKRPSRKTKPQYAVLVDGETEKWYLDLMKQEEKITAISIEPKLPSKKSLADLVATVEDYFKKGYDQVVWIVDLDTLQKEDRETPKGETSVLEKFKQHKAKLERDFGDKLHVLVNSPCLEFWLLLHFKNTSKFFDKCEDAETELKKQLEDYEKTEKYYKKANSNLYKKLKDKQLTAKSNASKLGSYDPEEPDKAKAEFFRIFDILGI